jgi:hypothetical protein
VGASPEDYSAQRATHDKPRHSRTEAAQTRVRKRRILRAYRRPGEKRHEMQPRRENHWSAKVHCWGIIGIGFKQLVVLEKNVCSETYCAMLEKHLFDPDETSFISDHRVLMQDGAKPHTAKATLAYLKEKNVELLPWAPYSPDWNPSRACRVGKRSRKRR